jgi:hypothetical protein
MKYAVEMGSGTMTYTKFHKDWFRHSEAVKLEHTHTHTHTQQGDLINLLFFHTKENILIMVRALIFGENSGYSTGIWK